MKKILCLLIAIGLTFSITGCNKKETSDTKPSNDTTKEDNSSNKDSIEKKPEILETLIQFEPLKEGEDIAVFETSMGKIKFRLFPQYAPKTVDNFTQLINKKYYNGIIFHRVINDFMIQSGDPTGTGFGGESAFGKAFEDEFTPKLHNFRGSLSMANAGKNTNGSQFFVVQAKVVPTQLIDAMKSASEENFSSSVIKKYSEIGGTPSLDYIHTVFGHVIEGMDVVDKIAVVETIEPKKKDKPVEDITIVKAYMEKYSK